VLAREARETREARSPKAENEKDFLASCELVGILPGKKGRDLLFLYKDFCAFLRRFQGSPSFVLFATTFAMAPE
jgi:hypothetical protein